MPKEIFCLNDNHIFKKICNFLSDFVLILDQKRCVTITIIMIFSIIVKSWNFWRRMGQRESFNNEIIDFRWTVMGGERLWWTWGMARGTVPNTSLLIASAGTFWNASEEQEVYNATENLTASNPGNFSEEKHDFLLMIVTASFLALLILITIIGK